MTKRTGFLRRGAWVIVSLTVVMAAGCGDDDGGNGSCGDGQLGASEDCDGNQLGGLTCADVGNYSGGILGCTQRCTFDTSLCTAPVNCGNGQLDTGEECDGANLDGQQCADVGAFSGGTLTCGNDCTFDTSLCTGGTDCGNGQVDSGEECDGADLNGQQCAGVGAFSGGTLTCGNDCAFDTSLCTADTSCPRETLQSATSVTYHGDTTGLPDLATSSRLEWQDAPDDTLLFTAPEAGDYEIVTTAEPSSNGGCGASVWDYGTDSYYDASWCPAGATPTEIDGFYSSAGYPYTFAAGETVMIWFSCTYWSDVQSGPYTITITKQ